MEDAFDNSLGLFFLRAALKNAFKIHVESIPRARCRRRSVETTLFKFVIICFGRCMPIARFLKECCTLLLVGCTCVACCMSIALDVRLCVLVLLLGCTCFVFCYAFRLHFVCFSCAHVFIYTFQYGFPIMFLFASWSALGAALVLPPEITVSCLHFAYGARTLQAQT